MIKKALRHRAIIQSLNFRWLIFLPLLMLFAACTDQEPYVTELRAIPEKISLGDKYFYPKPFSIRAKYSNDTEKNINDRITWVSENISLLTINQKGELNKNADCLEVKCVVNLIATDPESGKSVRVSVLIKPSTQKKSSKKLKDKPALMQDSIAEIENQIEETESIVTQNQAIIAIPIVESAGQSGIENNHQGEKTSIRSSPSINTKSVLKLQETDIELTSGDRFRPIFLNIDQDTQQSTVLNVPLKCTNSDVMNASVYVLPDCELIAIEPGQALINVELLDAQHSIQEDLSVSVAADVISASPEGANVGIDLSDSHMQKWIQVTGLQAQGYFRVSLNGISSSGYRILIYTRPSITYPTCVNTWPENFNSVACYFKAEQNDLTVVIDNPLRQAINGVLNIEAVSIDKFSFLSLQNIQNAVDLSVGNSFAAFIFANEAGGNNRHHYRFVKSDSIANDFLIKLFDFDALLKLEVSWEGGFCNEDMMKRSDSEVVCRLPGHVLGNILIVINGNNGEFGLSNGAIAALGGSKYSIVVDKVQVE